jgi:hypothetical protein
LRDLAYVTTPSSSTVNHAAYVIQLRSRYCLFAKLKGGLFARPSPFFSAEALI